MNTDNLPQALPPTLADHVTTTENGCWEWQGPRLPSGYGRISSNGGTVYTHRLAYELAVGPIPDGLHIDHLCRNRPCCNPAHLEPVTSRENTLRSPIAMAAINARKTHCKRGHEFTPDNAALTGKYGRSCKQCRAEWEKQRRTTDPAYLARRRATIRESMRRHRARKAGVHQGGDI